MDLKNQDKDSITSSHTKHEKKQIGRTTYFVCHYFTGNRPLENVLERLILSDKSLL
ncbi:hypothetical protein ACQRDX_09120 [Streptococcus sp. SGI.013]|uniref:hypothetical protein n=1 Tax=Streptococcus TaxID=1301 RepID=UPI003D0120E2